MDLIQKLNNFNAKYNRTVVIDPEEHMFYEHKQGSEEKYPIRLPNPAPATLHDALRLMEIDPEEEIDLEQGFTEEEKYLRMLVIEYMTDIYDPETAKGILKKTYNIE